MLLFKHKSYHKLQIYAYMISWLRVLELENTKGLMNLRKRLGMSFKCWLRQWPFQGKVSPALESSPSLGEGRRQRGWILPHFQAGPEVWWWQGIPSILLPAQIHPLTTFPAKPQQCPSAPHSSSQARRAQGGSQSRERSLIPPHPKLIYRSVHWTNLCAKFRASKVSGPKG